MCTITKAVSGTTLTCANTGANTHTGLHYATAVINGRNLTWRWTAPAASPTVLNTDDVPAAHKAQVVGQADA